MAHQWNVPEREQRRTEAPANHVCESLAALAEVSPTVALQADATVGASLKIDRGFHVSGESTKKAAVTRALQEFITRREQRQIAEFFWKA